MKRTGGYGPKMLHSRWLAALNQDRSVATFAMKSTVVRHAFERNADNLLSITELSAANTGVALAVLAGIRQAAIIPRATPRSGRLLAAR
jgi:hypothetical protein